MKYTVAVHFQFMSDNGEVMDKLLSLNKPFIASIVPNLLDKTMRFESGGKILGRLHPKDNYYPTWAIEFLRSNAHNLRIAWMQEGYRHCCEGCYEKSLENSKIGKGRQPDPYHEHVCLDGHVQSLEEQVSVIEKGKKLIEDNLGVQPVGYCPPNHLYNEDTLEAAKVLGFSHFMIKNAFDYFGGNISIPAYRDNNIIIFPESRLGQLNNSPVIATYYDYLENEKEWDNFSGVLESSSHYPSISKKSKAKVFANQKLLHVAKKLRDLKKRFR